MDISPEKMISQSNGRTTITNAESKVTEYEKDINSGKYKVNKATIIFYGGSINFSIERLNNKYSYEQYLGAVDGHETEHTTNDEVIQGTMKEVNEKVNYEEETIPNQTKEKILKEYSNEAEDK